MNNGKIMGIIPARFDSSRLPGKPLKIIGSSPMIQWVYEAAKKCKDIDRLIVATDDSRIYDVVNNFGGECMMTSKLHKSGTSRMCEVADKFPNYEYYINIQGDQPFISSSTLSEICLATKKLNKKIAVSTLVCELKEEEENDISVPKVVVSVTNKALYFSRFPIPFDVSLGSFNSKNYLKHLGVYGFTNKALNKIKGLEQSYLEKAESLEQLTWLYNNIPVYAYPGSDANKVSVDTQEDLNLARRMAKGEINE